MRKIPTRQLTAIMLVTVTLAACGDGPGGASTVPTATSNTDPPNTTTTTTLPATTSTSVFVPPPPVMPTHWAGLSTERLEVALFEVGSGDPEWLITTESGSLLGASLVRMGPEEMTYVETCCEPASGQVFVVDFSGSTSGASVGYFPVPSTDGQWLASTNGTLRVEIANLSDQGSSISLPDLPDAGIPIPRTDPIGLSSLAWSLDGTRLAFNYHTNTQVPSLLILDPFTASSAGDATVLFEGETVVADDETAPAWYLPVFTDLGLLVTESQMHPPFDLVSTDRGVIIDPATGTEIATIAYQPGVVVDQDTDPSGRYLIYVLSDGSVHWLSTTGDSGTLANHGYRSASW